MERRLSGRVLLLLSILVGATGCPPMESGRSQPALPDKVPEPPAIEFSRAGDEWPPRPQGRTNETTVPTTARPGAFTESMEASLRTAALQDARVRTALGERFGYVAAAEVEPDKERPPSSTTALPVRLTFFSYANNVAVEVL